MRFGIAIAALAVALTLGACSKPTTTTTATTSTTVTTSANAPASFTIGAVADTETNIQGCSSSFSRQGDRASEVFVENGADTDGFGFIRINNTLIRVELVSGNENEKGGTRTFADKGHTVSIVETVTTTASHPDTDSVEAAGTLAVTFGGSTQTLQVEGGTAC